jgi:hypothetical protein
MSDGRIQFSQHAKCRRIQLEAVVLKIDRMASAWLSHGRDEIKPFAKEVFDVCEQAIQTGDDTPAPRINTTEKTAEKTEQSD